MAIDRGLLYAQNYQLPQYQAPQQAPAAPATQYQDEIGDPAAELEQVDGVTTEYFNKWAQLKGFAREVQSTLGLDVRYPDPSVPESVRLHRIYLKALADLKGQGERLKTGQKMYMADRQRGSIIENQGEGQYYDELNVGTDIVDAKLDPIVEAANSKLNNYFYGNSIKEGQAYRESVLKELTARRDKNPDQAGYWQRQIDSLVTPTQGIREFAPNSGADDRARQSSMKAAGAHLDKVANLVMGTSKGYKLSDRDFGPNGEHVYVNRDMEGITYGGKVIKEWRNYPSSGKTEIVTSSGEVIPLTGQDVVSIAKGIVSENPRFGIDGKYIDMYADEKGYFGETGEVDPNKLVDSSVIEKTTADRLIQQEDADYLSDKEAVKTLEGEISKLKTYKLWPNDTFEGVTESGKPIEVKVDTFNGSKVYDITNISELIGPKDAKGKPRNFAPYRGMSKQALVKFLTKQGVHLTFKKTPQSVAQEPTPQASGTNVATPTSTGMTPEQEARAAALLQKYQNGR